MPDLLPGIVFRGCTKTLGLETDFAVAPHRQVAHTLYLSGLRQFANARRYYFWIYGGGLGL
jgi:glycerol uptake facilitator-like aquaporin